MTSRTALDLWLEGWFLRQVLLFEIVDVLVKSRFLSRQSSCRLMLDIVRGTVV